MPGTHPCNNVLLNVHASKQSRYMKTYCCSCPTHPTAAKKARKKRTEGQAEGEDDAADGSEEGSDADGGDSCDEDGDLGEDAAAKQRKLRGRAARQLGCGAAHHEPTLCLVTD